jgi:serine phosphatase RsbU (regulator of sigma subunit)/tetratricopeptide (TPR) repeat protein
MGSRLLFSKKCLIFLLMIARALIYSQNLDSLRQVLQNEKRDTVLINAWNAVGRSYILKANYVRADSLSHRALKLSQKIKFEKGLFNSFTNIGVLCYYQGKLPEALTNYLEALKIAEKRNDKALMARAMANVGLIYEDQEEYDKTLEYYFKALKLKEELKEPVGTRAILTNIGRVYRRTEDYQNALVYFSRSLELSKKADSRGMIALNLFEIGNIFENKKDTANALASYLESLQNAEEGGDKVLAPTVKAKIGTIYLNQKKLKEAEKMFLSGLTTADEIGHMENQKILSGKLADLYAQLKNWSLAYIYYKKHKEVEDVIVNDSKTKELVKNMMNFEFDKKQAIERVEQEKKDALAAEEIEDHKTQRNYFIAGFVLILLVAAVVFRSYRQTQKANKIIAAQKELVEEQKDLIEEKHKEITDSINYAERIQRSFLATKELLDANLGDYFVFFKPKDIVSGDFYWASALKNGNFALVTADSTGHGVPGAIMSILNISSLENAVKDEIQPSAILNHTRKTIIERLKKDGSPEGGKDGMDASLIVFSSDRKKIYVAAANNPVWIVRDSKVIEVKPDKMPLGKHDKQDMSFVQYEYDVEKGDMVYALTDGFPDQFGGEKGKKFMTKKLRELLIENAHQTMDLQKEVLVRTFSNWVGTLEQVDDVTVIGVRI